MSYTDDCGVIHSESYWKIVSIQYNVLGKFLKWTFYGYHNKESRSLGLKEIGIKEFEAVGEDYNKIYSSIVSQNSDYTNPTKAGYVFASQVANEIVNSSTPEEIVAISGFPDATVAMTFASVSIPTFFKNAVDV